MTPQEKDRIECAIRHIQTSLDVDPWAVEIAVEAMEKLISAQPEPCEDAVSRQAVINIINKPVIIKAKEQIEALPSVQPKSQPTCNNLATDCISRQAAIDTLYHVDEYNGRSIEAIRNLPSAQPELTDDRAIEHLQSTGWMQNHDKEMYEMGLREQLADDGGSYDSLIPCEDTISRQAAIDAVEHITSSMSVCVTTDECHGMKRMQRQAVIELTNLPSAHPEIIHCKDCCHYPGEYTDCPLIGWGRNENDFCSWAERRTDEGD